MNANIIRCQAYVNRILKVLAFEYGPDLIPISEGFRNRLMILMDDEFVDFQRENFDELVQNSNGTISLRSIGVFIEECAVEFNGKRCDKCETPTLRENAA